MRAAASQLRRSPAVALLDRLDKIKATGPGKWTASCPGHEDRSPSLSIRELDDGRLLLHDFGGCDVLTVLGALGLEMSALFPDGPLDHRTQPTHSRIPARDLLALIDHQAMIVSLIASDFLEHRAVDEATFQMLADAARRIGEARDIAAPATVAR